MFYVLATGKRPQKWCSADCLLIARLPSRNRMLNIHIELFSKCQLSILFLEGKRAIKRQLHSRPFTSSFFYSILAVVRIQCSTYLPVFCTQLHWTRLQLLPSESEATPNENHLYRSLWSLSADYQVYFTLVTPDNLLAKHSSKRELWWPFLWWIHRDSTELSKLGKLVLA